MADFLPRRDADLVTWTATFSQAIQTESGAYGLSVQQAAQYALTQADYARAYQAARDPSTRGLRTVMLKNQARDAVTEATRQLARIARAHPGITGVALVELGLKRGEQPSAALPAAGPRVRLQADSRQVTVTLRSETDRRARPRGATGAAVYWATGDAQPASLDDYTLAGNTTRQQMSFVLSGSAGQPGTKVWVVARWLDGQLQPGPAGPPASAHVGFGFMLSKAG